MIDVANLLYRIKECPHDDTLYLLEKVSNGGGFFALNGNTLYMVPSTEAYTSQNIKTEYLRLQTCTHISAFDGSSQSFDSGYYDFMSCSWKTKKIVWKIFLLLLIYVCHILKILKRSILYLFLTL